MDEIYTKQVITKPSFRYDDERYYKKAIFIGSCYLTNFREWITKRLGHDCFTNLGPYKLRIVENVYDVHLVVINFKNSNFFFYQECLIISCYNYKTIFLDLESFSRLKKVVEQKHMDIDSIQTWRGINSQKETIKIVTFIHEIDDIYDIFTTEKVKMPPEIMCWAFPWFNPLQIPQFDKQNVNDEFFVGLITFLQCQRELCYDMNSEFTVNVIELCSLKLAFCPEFGIESPACTALAHEIDGVIIDSLNRLTKDNSEDGYFRDNNHFNLLQYAYDREVDLYAQDLACFYFIYNFQDWIKSITIPNTLLDRRGYASINLVKDHKFILSRLRKLQSVHFNIDGTQFSGMDFKLFSGLLEMENVNEIILDTNYRWLNVNESNNLTINNIMYYINKTIIFIGDNKFNFIEDCISCLELIENIKVYLTLTFVNPKIESFLIFKKLFVGFIELKDLTLTSSILSELIACEFYSETKIVFENCIIIVDNEQSWTLLNELNFLEAEIIEAEKTWQFVFDYIVNQMKDSNTNEFTFKKKIKIKTQNGIIISLNRIKFTIVEFESRLEIRDRDTNETLDLFDLKNKIQKNSCVEKDYSEEEDSEEEDSDENGSLEESSEIQFKRKLSLIDEFQPISKQNKLN